jgi:hypothetical protein
LQWWVAWGGRRRDGRGRARANLCLCLCISVSLSLPPSLPPSLPAFLPSSLSPSLPPSSAVRTVWLGAGAAFSKLSPSNMAVVIVICCLLVAYWTLVLWGWRKDRADRAAASAAAAEGTAAGGAGSDGDKTPGTYRLTAMETLKHAQARTIIHTCVFTLLPSLEFIPLQSATPLTDCLEHRLIPLVAHIAMTNLPATAGGPRRTLFLIFCFAVPGIVVGSSPQLSSPTSSAPPRVLFWAANLGGGGGGGGGGGTGGGGSSCLHRFPLRACVSPAPLSLQRYPTHLPTTFLALLLPSSASQLARPLGENVRCAGAGAQRLCADEQDLAGKAGPQARRATAPLRRVCKVQEADGCLARLQG